jgi:hypothetical protein
LTSGAVGPSFTHAVGQTNPDEEIVMKNGLGVLVCALSLLALASTAQSGGQEASGTFAFDLGTATGTVNFAAQAPHGTPSGQISLHATIDISGEACQQVNVGTEENPDIRNVCEPTGSTTPTNVALDLLIDHMVVVNNRAAISGTITGDSPFNGQHTILAVEDGNGSNNGFTWGVYKPKFVNTLATDYDFCPTPPPNCVQEENCPPCRFDGLVINDQNVPSNQLTYTASDYELCIYPPPTDTCNFLDPFPCPAGDPHNYTCFTGAPDPNVRPAGIPVEAIHTLINADSFPLFTYPMTPIPNGGGNKLTVTDKN